jgi:hypothetical protein
MRGEQAFSLYENPFMDLRQSLMRLALNRDEGRDTFLFKDQVGSYFILMVVAPDTVL